MALARSLSDHCCSKRQTLTLLKTSKNKNFENINVEKVSCSEIIFYFCQHNSCLTKLAE